MLPSGSRRRTGRANGAANGRILVDGQRPVSGRRLEFCCYQASFLVNGSHPPKSDTSGLAVIFRRHIGVSCRFRGPSLFTMPT